MFCLSIRRSTGWDTSVHLQPFKKEKNRSFQKSTGCFAEILTPKGPVVSGKEDSRNSGSAFSVVSTLSAVSAHSAASALHDDLFAGKLVYNNEHEALLGSYSLSLLLCIQHLDWNADRSCL